MLLNVSRKIKLYILREISTHLVRYLSRTPYVNTKIPLIWIFWTLNDIVVVIIINIIILTRWLGIHAQSVFLSSQILPASKLFLFFLFDRNLMLFLGIYSPQFLTSTQSSYVGIPLFCYLLVPCLVLF